MQGYLFSKPVPPGGIAALLLPPREASPPLQPQADRDSQSVKLTMGSGSGDPSRHPNAGHSPSGGRPEASAATGR